MIDFRSDTVTHPTEAMRKAMADAAVGDDVYGDDPGILELEALGARMLGKEASLFVPSGTFGNQLALFTWCPRGSEVLLAEQCHIIEHEAGAASVIAGVQTRTINAADGCIDPGEIEKRIRGEDIHFPPTSLVCMENAHSSGRLVPLQAMEAVFKLAKKYKLPVHLDGARIFNAATALNTSAAEIAAYSDSVMCCLSKGLCAPIGSLLAGTAEFIAKARKKRKIMGGGMRQAGILGAAGILALRDMTKRLSEDHERARKLAVLLAKIPGISVNMDQVQINMVFASHPDALVPEKTKQIMQSLHEREILANPPENGVFRFVTHYWIDDNDIELLAEALKEALASCCS